MTELLQRGEVRRFAGDGDHDEIVGIVTGIDNQNKILQLCVASITHQHSSFNFEYALRDGNIVAHPNLLIEALPEQLGHAIASIGKTECEQIQECHFSLLLGEALQNVAEPTTRALEVAMRIFEEFVSSQYGDGLYTYLNLPEQFYLSKSIVETPSFWIEFVGRRQPFNFVAWHFDRMVQQLVGDNQEDATSTDPRLLAAVLSKLANSHINESRAELPERLTLQIDDNVLTKFYEAGIRTIEELTPDSGVAPRGRLIPGTNEFLRFRKLVIEEAKSAAL
jgi:hypothetical protein